jgi:hypothetical protein
MESGLPRVATASEVAAAFGVTPSHVAQWAADLRLPACARSECGELLFYRWRVLRDGPRLAAEEPIRVMLKNPKRSLRNRETLLINPPSRPCGCSLDPATGRAFLICGEAYGLDLARRLTAAFNAAAPADPFFRHLAEVTREAFERHIADPGQRNATVPPGRDGGQLLSDCSRFGGIKGGKG